MRLVIVACLLLLVAAPEARAAEPHCFGPGKTWCAWTRPTNRPDDGWKVVHKAPMNGAFVETVFDSPDNRPRLAVRVLPATALDSAQVIISLRPDDQRPDRWRQYVGRNREFEDGALRLTLGRRALESVLQAPASANLYVFVELRTQASSRKDSYKIPLAGLSDALRFARLGR